jgi:hypothetical protein
MASELIEPIALLPCPYCGAQAELSCDKTTNKNGHVWCTNDLCGVDIYGWTKEETVARWNTRVSPEFICDRCSLRQDSKPKIEPQF